MRLHRILGVALAAAGFAALAVALGGCNQQTVEAKLRSLEASGDATYVCVGIDRSRSPDWNRGFELSRCPDRDSVDPTRKMAALVTQTATNELAIVDLADQAVVDVDPAIPGFTFLRLPSRPGAIVSTPGGEASFVGLTTPGKTGISAIPTTCLGAPRGTEHERDITTFGACTLPSTPGEMVVVVEPPAADGTIAASCADPTVAQTTPPASATDGRDCVSDLTTEGGPPGRRKLVVALPETGQLAVIDAQWLLDRQPGSFGACEYQLFDLKDTLDASGQGQVVPEDLKSKTCHIPQPVPPPVPVGARPRPSGLSLSADGRLFVGDLGVPVVHVLDASSACHLKELEPLLPMSFTAPDRVVTTSRLVVSPVTPKGKQYVYAIDANDQPTSSVMAFDVSGDSANRTPIVRDGSARQPREVPDRISFGAPVQDLEFAYRDLPREDLASGVAEVGVECDPDPTHTASSANPLPSPGVQDRTTPDYTQGARPRFLRGLFGLVMLTSGQVVVIDVDDFDAPCRRPISTNHSATPDYRGCQADPADLPDFLTNGPDGTPGDATQTPTVSNEVSCNMVEPHRARANGFGISLPTLGLGAPSLRGLPQFTPPASVESVSPASRPRMLSVPFARTPSDPTSAVEPLVYVDTTLYKQDDASAPLNVNPSDSPYRDSLTLPLVEPRSYAASEAMQVTYEGRVFSPDKQSGFIDGSGLASYRVCATPPAGDGSSVECGALSDPSALFCNSGVYDVLAMKGYAVNVLGMADSDADQFAKLHADYVQITGDFPSLIDPYWQSAAAPAGGRAGCVADFGEPPRTGATELSVSRDLLVLEAFQDHLVLAPRNPLRADPSGVPRRKLDCVVGSDDFDAAACAGRWDGATFVGPSDAVDTTWERLGQCFPGGVRYTVRGSNHWVVSGSRPEVLHDVIADPDDGFHCVRDCDPRRQLFHDRAFEIGHTATCGGSCLPVQLGAATGADGPCSYDGVDAAGKTRGVALDDGAAACIFENLTARFAIYRGLDPSVRDMTFNWATSGGYYPLAASLASVSSAVLPQRVKYIPEYQAIGVIDAASLGVALMSLDSLRIADPWPVY